MKKQDVQYRSLCQVYVMIISISIGTVAQGFSMYVLNGPLDEVKIILDIHGNHIGFYEGILVSASSVGALIGALAVLPLVKQMSRKGMLHIFDFILSVGCGFCYIDNIYLFVFGRFLQGISQGVYSIVIYIYLKEVIPLQIYAMGAGLNLIFLSLGTIIQCFMALGFPDVKGLKKSDLDITFWQIYLCIPIIFTAIRTFMLQFIFRFDSPIYYLKNQDYDNAKRFIQQYYKDEYQEETLHLYEKALLQRLSSPLFSKQMRGRLSLGILCFTFYSLCGINAIINYSTSIFKQVTSVRVAEILTVGMGILKFICYLTGAIVTQKFGRRPPIIFGTGLLSISLIALGIAAYAHDDNQLVSQTLQNALPYIIICLVYVYFITFFNTIGAIFPPYIPEILPEKGVAVAHTFQNSCSIIQSFLFPTVKELFGMAINFFAFGLFTLIGTIYFIFNMKETLGLNESQVALLFKKVSKTSPFESQVLTDNSSMV